jgi:hypothetical protein
MPSWEIGTMTTVFAEGLYHGTYLPITWNSNFLKYQHSCTFRAPYTTKFITPISISTSYTFDYATI